MNPRVQERPPAGHFSDPAEWYRRHHALVRDAVLRWGIAPSSVDDAVQDTFAIAFRQRHRFEGGSMVAWLYAIARRVASNARRSAVRHHRKSLALATSHVPELGRGPEVGAAVVVIERFLATLPPVQREIFTLCEIEGLTGPEIAACLGQNLATTYTRIRTVRRRFATHCDDTRAVIAGRRAARPAPTNAACIAFADGLTKAALVPSVGSGFGVWTTAAVLSAGLAATVLVGVGVVARGVPPAADRPGNARTDVRAAVVADASVDSPPRLAPKKAEPDAAHPAPRGEPASSAITSPSRQALRADTNPVRVAAPAATLSAAAVALREGRASDAMQMLHRHRRAFPRSAVADVRDALRIEALCSLGRAVDARRAATAFETTYPDSPLTTRVAGACRE